MPPAISDRPSGRAAVPEQKTSQGICWTPMLLSVDCPLHSEALRKHHLERIAFHLGRHGTEKIQAVHAEPGPHHVVRDDYVIFRRVQ